MLTSRHVQAALGPLPKGSRLATPAAEFLGQHLQGPLAELIHAAARVCAQHLHHVSRHSPHLGSKEAIHLLARDLGIPHVGHFHSAHPDMVEAYESNQPLGVLIGGAIRHTRHEPKTRKEANYVRGGIEHDLRDAVVHHRKQPTKRELAEMKRDLARLGGRMEGGMLYEGGGLMEGGAAGAGWFSDMAKHAVSAAKAASSHPMGQMMAHQAMQMAMAHPAAQQLSAAHDMASAHPMGAMGLAMAKKMMGGACGCGGGCGGACGGRRRAHEGVGYAEMNVHRGKKPTKKEEAQMVRDLKKYGVGAPPKHRGIHKSSLYEAFRKR